MEDKEIREAVKERYGRIAAQVCSCSSSCCCSDTANLCSAGYTEEQLAAVPDGARLSLGCGNPAALASLKEGEVITVPGLQYKVWPLLARVLPRNLIIRIMRTQHEPL